MAKSYFEKEIKSRIKELDSMEDVLAIGSLTMASYASSARSAMLTQHLVQALVPNNPEVPGVTTGYEHMFGEFSSSYKKTDKRLSVIKKIKKYDDHIYTLLVQDKNGEFDIIERNEVKHLAESYGYRYNNEVIDSLKQGDKISKDMILYKSPCLDEYGNYRYGVNAKCVYVVSQETIEDAIVVSESFAKKLSTTKVDTCTVMLNDNDLFLNVYGNNEDYKAFPDIGEKMKNSVLCATRKKNKTLDQLNMKNSALRKLFPNDDIYQFQDNYYVADIQIWSNKPYEEIPDIPAYKQFRKYYKLTIDYYTEIYNIFGKIINTPGAKYTKEFSRLYAKARDFLDPTCKYAEDEKIFSNAIIEFSVYKSVKLFRGCKLCGRYGNKSVISKVISDKEMGRTEDGITPDIRIDALGVLGRLNSGQCMEQELNWIAELVRQQIAQKDDMDKQFKLLFKFIKLVNRDQYNELYDYVESLSKDEKKSFIQEIIDDRIYIMQSPIYSITGDEMLELYKEFEPKKVKMIYTDIYGRETETIREMIVADEYFLRLKQEPISKTSVRSKSLINPRSFMPIKSTKASKKKAILPDQCNKIGEQELNILMLSNDSDALDYFYRSSSSSVEGRRTTTLFTEDPKNGFIINMETKNSRSVDMLNAYLKAMGYALEIEYEDDNDGIDCYEVKCDVPDVPDFISNLFEKSIK